MEKKKETTMRKLVFYKEIDYNEIIRTMPTLTYNFFAFNNYKFS